MLTPEQRSVLSVGEINGGESTGTYAVRLADARLGIRELEGEVAGWKSAVETVEAQRDDARLRIRELEEKLAISATEWKAVNLKLTEQQQRTDTLTEELRELDAQLGVCERDYESMCETASREIERKNKAIEAAELVLAWYEPVNSGGSKAVRELRDINTAQTLLAEAKGETP